MNVYEISRKTLEIRHSDHTAAEKQADARALAIDVQSALADQAISYGELAVIQDSLQALAQDTGLVDEFSENGLI